MRRDGVGDCVCGLRDADAETDADHVERERDAGLPDAVADDQERLSVSSDSVPVVQVPVGDRLPGLGLTLHDRSGLPDEVTERLRVSERLPVGVTDVYFMAVWVSEADQVAVGVHDREALCVAVPGPE